MNRGSFAPIAIFAYKRTRHLAQALDALEACPEFLQSPVFVFSDGPRDEAARPQVAAVREMLQARRQPNMTIVESVANRGLAASVVSGVTKLCDEYGRAIVIEDDLIVSPRTLGWLNAGLDRFADVPSVWQVSAHQFDVPEFSHRMEGMLLHLSTSWGWATWKRAWDKFDAAATGWQALKTDKALRARFDLDRSYPYTDLLLKQMAGQVDSWAIRWWWSMFSAGGCTLFPPRSLVSNIGLDETATHSVFGRIKRLVVSSPPVAHEVVCSRLPDATTPNASDDAVVRKGLRRMWWSTRLRARLRRRL